MNDVESFLFFIFDVMFVFLHARHFVFITLLWCVLVRPRGRGLSFVGLCFVEGGWCLVGVTMG